MTLTETKLLIKKKVIIIHAITQSLYIILSNIQGKHESTEIDL